MNKKSILIVDDEDVYHSLIEKMFNHLMIHSYTFHTAFNPLEGSKLLKEHKPSLVLTDILMPKKTGDYMVEQTKKRYPEVPVVVMTGTPYDDATKRAIEMGADYLLKKPFGLSNFKKTIQEIYLKNENLEGKLVQ